MRLIIFFFVAFFLLAIGSYSIAEENQSGPIATDTAIPYKETRADSGASYLRVVVVFIIVIGFVILGAYFFTRSSIKDRLSAFQGQRIKIIETKRIFPKVNVYLIQVDAKEYLLTQSNDGVVLLEHGETTCEQEEAADQDKVASE